MERQHLSICREMNIHTVKIVSTLLKTGEHGDTYWDEEDDKGNIVLNALKPEVF